jgi:hypothetical protein
MKPTLPQSQLAIVTVATLTILAGCSGSAQAPVNPATAPFSSAHRIGLLTTVSTMIGIRNDWIATIHGSGSAPCWTISPGLPSVGAFGKLSGPITLSYTPLCPGRSTLSITYGPGGSGTSANCTFNVSSDGTNFFYAVTQGSGTACTVGPSVTAGYDEILTYAQQGPDAKRSLPLRGSQ